MPHQCSCSVVETCFFHPVFIFFCRYEIMLDCWRENPRNRPSFTRLAELMENLGQLTATLQLSVPADCQYHKTLSSSSDDSESELVRTINCKDRAPDPGVSTPATSSVPGNQLRQTTLGRTKRTDTKCPDQQRNETNVGNTRNETSNRPKCVLYRDGQRWCDTETSLDTQSSPEHDRKDADNNEELQEDSLEFFSESHLCLKNGQISFLEKVMRPNEMACTESPFPDAGSVSSKQEGDSEEDTNSADRGDVREKSRRRRRRDRNGTAHERTRDLTRDSTCSQDELLPQTPPSASQNVAFVWEV